ncbi:MAG: hypothetical protein H0W30_08265 [Gemmatimonadaceae bacterium]|nr:hypothetical protein [Gemmatimonadaceae bacterium]
MKCFVVSLSFVAAATFANTSEAQRRDRGENLPAKYRPPAGQCRIWIDRMPGVVQNKPMDCDDAERAAKARTYIVYGSEVPLPTSQAKGQSSEKGDQWCNENDRRNNPDCKGRNRDNDDDDRKRDNNRAGSRDRARYPERLPEMQTARLYQRGQRPEQIRRWVGERNVKVEVIDADNNGVPERAEWLNQSGEIVQVWTDRNRDGRADRVVFYDDGKPVRVFEK